MTGIFSINSAEKMFEHLQKKWDLFYKNPSDELLIDTLFPLYHLREWIFPKDHKNCTPTEKEEMSREEKLHKELHTNASYIIIRELCNQTKHFRKVKKGGLRTDIISGAPVNLLRCGDTLNSNFYIVDDIDIRIIFNEAYGIYYNYFN